MSTQLPSVAGLFVGCGGLDYGFQQAGYGMEWANEFNQDAAASYRELVGHEVVVDDIWNVIDQVPKAEILVGGPPCQSFSLVGKRLNDDPRGKLVFAYQQVVERVKPLVFVMENVPGMMASRIDDKRLTQYLGEQFAAMGYWVNILKLVATDYFVPQKRHRVFMVGHRIPKIAFEMIPSDEFARLLGEESLRSPVTVAEALDDLPSPLPKGSKASIAYARSPHSAFVRLLRNQSGNEVFLHSIPTMSALDREFVRHIPPGGNYTNIPDSVSTTRIMSFKATGGRTTTYGRLDSEKPAYTINTFFNRPNVGANYHHREERLITVREAMRLQSFPDYFIPAHTNQRSLHMQIGNAVPPLLARAVAESVKKIFG